MAAALDEKEQALTDAVDNASALVEDAKNALNNFYRNKAAGSNEIAPDELTGDLIRSIGLYTTALNNRNTFYKDGAAAKRNATGGRAQRTKKIKRRSRSKTRR